MKKHPAAEPPKEDNLNLAVPVAGEKPSRSRLSDPHKAQDLAAKIIEHSSARSRKNALIKGQVDGNLPYNPQSLKAAAQGWRTNVNFGGAKAAVSSALTPFYDLFTGAQHFFIVQTKFGANAKERNDYARAISEEADYIVKEWDGFDFNMQAMLFEMVTFGKGHLLWPIDQRDWRFSWLQQHLILVPDNTKAHGRKVPVAVIREDYLVHELWHLISKPRANDSGWNVAFAKRCIEHAYPPSRGRSGMTVDYEAVQQRMKDNDLCEAYEASKIAVYHLLITELDGKVTHLIVPENSIPTTGVKQAEDCDFLFQQVGAYEHFGQAVTSFFFETLDGSWNGANGIGKDTYAANEILNKLYGATIDGAFLRSGPTLQAKDASSLDKVNLVQIGAFNILPHGFDVQNGQIMADLQGPMAASRMCEGIISQNTGIYRPKIDKPEGNPRTAEEVRLNFQASATLSNSAVNRFYLNLDKLYTELFRRLVKDPDFRKRCQERGIPPQAIDQISCVKAVRTVGNGSPFMRQQATRELAGLVPMMPETGRLEWCRDTVSAVANSYAANRYFPERDDETNRTVHHWEAGVENGLLKFGAPVEWTPTQNNVIHAQVHIQFASAAASTLQQGGNPLDILNTLDRVGAHAALHLQKLEGDKVREAEFKVLTEEWNRLAKLADELRKHIERARQQQAEQQQQAQEAAAVEQGVDPESRIKLAKAQQDLANKQRKADQQFRHKEQAHVQKQVLSDAKAVSGIVLSKAKTDAQIQQQEAAAAAAQPADE